MATGRTAARSSSRSRVPTAAPRPPAPRIKVRQKPLTPAEADCGRRSGWSLILPPRVDLIRELSLPTVPASPRRRVHRAGLAAGALLLVATLLLVARARLAAGIEARIERTTGHRATVGSASLR